MKARVSCFYHLFLELLSEYCLVVRTVPSVLKYVHLILYQLHEMWF